MNLKYMAISVNLVFDRDLMGILGSNVIISEILYEKEEKTRFLKTGKYTYYIFQIIDLIKIIILSTLK